MPDKALIWLGISRRDLRAFPALARRLAGFKLRRSSRDSIRTTGSRCERSDRESVSSGFIAGAHRGFLRGDATGSDLGPVCVREENAEDWRTLIYGWAATGSVL